jgi:hypothetical protein
MPQQIYHVRLSGSERQQLESYVKHGKPAARAVTRARILLLAEERYPDEEIMEVLGVSRPTVASMRRKYQEQKGRQVLELLPDAARPGQPLKVDSRVAAHVALIACSAAPPGAVDSAVDCRPSGRTQSGRGYLSGECPPSVKKNALKPWLHQRWCIGKITGEYLWHMEDILDQYARPYDPQHPLLCYDERPCQLLGDVLVPLPMEPGQPQRVDYEYERQGTCCVLLAFEPYTGFR